MYRSLAQEADGLGMTDHASAHNQRIAAVVGHGGVAIPDIRMDNGNGSSGENL